LVRVTASDGFNCTQAQSQGTFTVPDHAPTADVSSPEDNRLYVGEQMIILEGTGADIEDGSLDGSRLAWTSDLNGPLGTGTSLAINAMTLQEAHTRSRLPRLIAQIRLVARQYPSEYFARARHCLRPSQYLRAN
jgi:hypothetical protein